MQGNNAVFRGDVEASKDHVQGRTFSGAVTEGRNTTTTPSLRNNCVTVPIFACDPNFSDVDIYGLLSYLHFKVSARPVQKDTFMTGTELQAVLDGNTTAPSRDAQNSSVPTASRLNFPHHNKTVEEGAGPVCGHRVQLPMPHNSFASHAVSHECGVARTTGRASESLKFQA